MIWLPALLLFPFALHRNAVRAAGNTTCVSSALDWYTSAVGETPCTTYQRLRRICNSQYQVPSFRPNTPGDNCDDQLQSCCCNSISWALSMLCMNCQQNTDPNGTGIDAGAGAYNIYRANGNDQYCSPGTNMTLPNDIQLAVCNSGIRLDNFLYNLFWGTGDWFYIYSKQTAQKDQIANNNNTFTVCPNQISSTATPTSTASKSSHSLTSSTGVVLASSTSSPAAGHSAESNKGAVIGGGVAAGIVSVALVLLICWFFYKRRRGSHPDIVPEYTPVPFVAAMGENLTDAPHDPFYSPQASSNPAFDAPSMRQNKMASALSLPGGSSTADASNAHSSDGLERERDGGPLVMRTPSQYSRLPPAYLSWEANSSQGAPLTESGNDSEAPIITQEPSTSSSRPRRKG